MENLNKNPGVYVSFVKDLSFPKSIVIKNEYFNSKVFYIIDNFTHGSSNCDEDNKKRIDYYFKDDLFVEIHASLKPSYSPYSFDIKSSTKNNLRKRLKELNLPFDEKKIEGTSNF